MRHSACKSQFPSQVLESQPNSPSMDTRPLVTHDRLELEICWQRAVPGFDGPLARALPGVSSLLHLALIVGVAEQPLNRPLDIATGLLQRLGGPRPAETHRLEH